MVRETPPLRMTQATQLVLRAMLAEPTREAYGAELGRAVGLPSGTITPIVARLENAGILTSRVEDVDPARVGRPRRKYYSFTADGAERARHELARVYRSPTAVDGAGRTVWPGPAGGPRERPGTVRGLRIRVGGT
jgi:PadR family transcriptional regulator, regulatory protein PadR